MDAMLSEYLTSIQMANQKETGKKKVVKKEEVDDRYSAVGNAGDQKKKPETVKRSIDSMFRRSVKVETSTAEVENTECQQPARIANQITCRQHATIAPIPIKVKNNGSTDRPESATSTTTSAATGANEHSIWESDPGNHDDGCSDDEGDMNETVSSKQCQVEANSNNANGCDGGFDICVISQCISFLGQFACLVCAAVFETYAVFKVHIATHAGYRRYKCTVCEQRFRRSDILKIHMRSHTGERTFECDVCEKKFTRSGHLIEHKRIHTGERPFKCVICEKKFTQSGHLIEHRRTHTGARPYKCDICHKGFVGSGDLVRHKRIHSGEKPYKCMTCGKCFSRNHHLQRHKRTHADPDVGSQPNVSQDGMDQSSTADACDALDNSVNGQKIRYKSKSIGHVVEKMTSRNPDIVYLVWSKQFTMELATAVARSGFNCILCVKNIRPEPFRDVVKLSDGLHTCVAEIGPDTQTLRLFSFGGMFIPEKITNHGTFKSLGKFESKMRRFSQSEGMKMVNIFKHSERNSGWYKSLKDGLKGDSIITDYV